MKKAIVLILLVILFMGLTVFSGCEDGVIEQDEEMVELNNWTFTSGVPNNLITVKHPDENAKFELRANKGMLFGTKYSQSDVINNGDTACWIEHSPDDKLIEFDYVDIIVRVDNNIVGYVVIKVFKQEDPLYYGAEVVKSVVFPKVDNQHQEVTLKQVEKRIKAAKG